MWKEEGVKLGSLIFSNYRQSSTGCVVVIASCATVSNHMQIETDIRFFVRGITNASLMPTGPDTWHFLETSSIVLSLSFSHSLL